MQASPTNTSFHTKIKPEDSALHRATSMAYSEEMRQRLIRRVLRNMPTKQHVGKSISIQQYNGQPRMIDPPYGLLPFALMSEKGEVSKEELIKAINFCGDRKKEYERSGDYYRMWLWAQRQSMLAGVLSHLVKFKLA